ILPSHREVVAVNYLPYLIPDYWGRRVAPADIAGLEAAQGPAGECTAVIIAFLLIGGPADMIPVILRMAARGELPAEAIGRQLALVLRRTWQEIRPALAALRELAEAGGHHEVWRIVRALLPGMLPGRGGASRRPTPSSSPSPARWRAGPARAGRSRSSASSPAAAGRAASSTSAGACTPG